LTLEKIKIYIIILIYRKLTVTGRRGRRPPQNELEEYTETKERIKLKPSPAGKVARLARDG